MNLASAKSSSEEWLSEYGYYYDHYLVFVSINNINMSMKMLVLVIIMIHFYWY